MKKIASKTFGCKVNQYETSCIVDEFLNRGYKKCEFSEIADVYIINTCTVTNRTDYKSRNAIRKALKKKQEYSNAKVVVTGCYSQRKKEEIKALGAVDLIVDNNSKSKIYRLLNTKNEPELFNSLENACQFDELSTNQMLDKTRAFVKVQDGCDYFCAYCAIPYARGHSRSRDKDNVLKQIEKLVAGGYKEFVLGGINLGLYGKEKEDHYLLPQLIDDIEKIEGVKLIRLSSIEPELITNELLTCFKNSKKVCPHFHIPLQVGSDELLMKMNRRYTTSQFTKTIKSIKNVFPNAAIGIDVITGVPGETDRLFQQTYDYLKDLDFTYLHVFSYSKRPGTKAAKMKDQIHGNVIKARTKELIELSNLKTKIYQKYILNKGIELSAIVEQKVNDYWTALSDHFIRIYTKDSEDISGKYIKSKPIKMRNDGLEVIRLTK